MLKATQAAIALTLGVVLVLASPAVAIAAECSYQQQQTGGCVTGELDAGEVIIEGSTTTPGTPGTPGTGGSGGGGGASSETPANPDKLTCIRVLNGRCFAFGPGRDGPVQPVEPVQPITLADIAHFRPDAGVDRMEPNGWMIVGLDTNFYSPGGAQVHDGTLLGQPASVRFTPVAWHWSYGDGTAASRATPGSTWAAQGIREFDPTETSHVYESPGTYVIDLTIDFRAEYRFAGMPWLAIPGVLPVPANRLVAEAGSAKTVLVERECTLNPVGPGC